VNDRAKEEEEDTPKTRSRTPSYKRGLVEITGATLFKKPLRQ